MPQEESKRGAHFAKGSAPQTPAPASFDNEIRNAWSAAADPGETAVYLRAAGAGTALPRTVLSSARPDETAVFLAAAQSSASVMPIASEAPRALRPDETAGVLMAALPLVPPSPRLMMMANRFFRMTNGRRLVRPIPSRAWPSTVMTTGTLWRFLPEPSPPMKLTRCLATMPYSMMMPYPVTTCRTAMTPHLLITPFWLTIPLR